MQEEAIDGKPGEGEQSGGEEEKPKTWGSVSDIHRIGSEGCEPASWSSSERMSEIKTPPSPDCSLVGCCIGVMQLMLLRVDPNGAIGLIVCFCRLLLCCCEKSQ